MGSPNQLSFLPDDYLERKAQRRTNAICAILFVLVMGGIGSTFALSERQTRNSDQEYTRIDRQYVTDAQRIDQVRKMTEKQKRISRQADLAASLLERMPRHRILTEITGATELAGVSLVDFTLDSKPRAKPAPAGEPPKTAYEQKKAARGGAAAKPEAVDAEPKQFDVQMKITGIARNDVQVAQFLNRLSRSSSFKDVNLIISDEFRVGEEKVRRFQIELALAPDAEAPVAAKNDPSQAAALELKE